jgi:hypothetical protein
MSVRVSSLVTPQWASSSGVESWAALASIDATWLALSLKLPQERLSGVKKPGYRRAGSGLSVQPCLERQHLSQPAPSGSQ